MTTVAEPKPSDDARDWSGNDGARSSGRGSPLVTDGTLIDPIYTQAETSETIALGKVSATFANGQKDSPRDASVFMRLAPTERLCFLFQNDPGEMMQAFRDFFDPNKDDGKLTLTDRGVKVDVSCVSESIGSHKGGTSLYVPRTSVVKATAPTSNIVKAVFHLFNFPDFIGPEDYFITKRAGVESGWSRCGRVVLKADGWTITIAATDKTTASCKALKEQGGFIITHMGKIERDDGSDFSSEQLENLLSYVRSFLSLSLGRWASVALPVGFDQDKNRVFEQWGMPQAASGSWNGACSWFDEHHGGLLSDLFPTFFERWSDDLWGPAIRAALYWYVAANDRGTGIGVDAGLILAQTALEHLAWTYCVQDRKMVSDRAFGRKGLSAADRLRLLATALDIPTVLPASLRSLHARRGRKWDDGADAITGIRNVLVHPDKKNDLAEGSYCEAWKLSLWILDLVFLRLLGHEGEYSNRLLSQKWVGQVETVPWGKGEDSSTSNE